MVKRTQEVVHKNIDKYITHNNFHITNSWFENAFPHKHKIIVDDSILIFGKKFYEDLLEDLKREQSYFYEYLKDQDRIYPVPPYQISFHHTKIGNEVSPTMNDLGLKFSGHNVFIEENDFNELLYLKSCALYKDENNEGLYYVKPLFEKFFTPGFRRITKIHFEQLFKIVEHLAKTTSKI